MERRSWDESFELLREFRAEHGHCNVPRTSGRSGRLADWVHLQRGRQREGRLSADRIAALEAIGFAWRVQPQHWEELFSRFLRWRKQHGHGDLPKRLPEDPELGTWVAEQRRSRKELSAEQEGRLTRAGFVWDPRTARWEAHFEVLRSYAERYGHTRVPAGYDSGLQQWVSNQRKAFRQRTIAKERIERLDAIGFEWYPPMGNIPPDHGRKRGVRRRGARKPKARGATSSRPQKRRARSGRRDARA
jgi:hypothetical protein